MLPAVMRGNILSKRGEDLYRLYKKGIVEDLYSGKNLTFIGVSSLG
jgi:hypothetical protein